MVGGGEGCEGIGSVGSLGGAEAEWEAVEEWEVLDLIDEFGIRASVLLHNL